MGRPAILSVRITADARRAQQGAQVAQRAFSGLASTIKSMAVTAAAAAGIGGIGALAAKAIKSASEVEQNFGALDAVFKGSAGQMKKWAAQAAQSAGLSKESYSGMAVVLGASLKNQGVALGDVGKLTNSLITKGADLASMFGGTTAEAVDALTAAFRGEADPVERYGLNLSQTAVNAYKAAHASAKLTDTQARLALITEQSKDSTGNFAKEADTLQGQVQRLTAQWDNMVAALGAKVLPHLTEAATVVNAKVLPALGSLASTIGDNVGPVVLALGAWFQDKVLPVLSEVGDQIQTTVIPALVALGSWIGDNVVPVLQTLGTFIVEKVLPPLGTLAATIVTDVIPAIAAFAQWITQTVDDWAPLITTVTVFVALMSGPYLAAIIAANVRGLVWAATMGIQAAAMTAVRIATTVWTGAQWLLNAAMTANPVGAVIALVVALAAGIYVAYQKSSTFRGIVQACWEWLKKMGGYVGGAFKSAWDGLVSGFNAVKDAIGWVIDKVSSLINWLGKIKMPKVLSDIGGAIGGLLSSPAPKQANTLRAAGRNTQWLGGPRNAPSRGRTALALNPQFHLMVSIDGQQLQGRITRTVTRALTDDGARLAAGGVGLMTVLARIISDTRRPVYVVVDGLPDEPHTVSLRRFGTPGDDPEVGRLVDRQEGAGSVTLQDPGDPGRGEPPNNPPYGVPITYEVEVDGENENPEMHEAAGSPVTLAESQPWPLPRLALEAKTSATPDDRATTTFTVTNGKQAGTATVATGDGRSIEITLDASGTGTGTYQYSDPGHHTYTATVTAPCPVRYSTWVSLESSIETWAAVGGFVDTWADPGRATETASATVEVDVGPATLWATVTPDQPLPYIQIDAWIGDPGTVTAWQIERVAPQGGGDQNVPIYLDDKSSGAISIEDHEAPLAQPVIYRLTITRKGGAVQVIESSPVVLGGTRGCFLTDTTSGATVAVTLRAWAERSRKARQSVLAVLNRADPVVLSDMHTTPEGKWVFLTRTQAELEALYGVLLSGRLVLLRTQPASAIRTTYAAVGDVSESRLYPELGDAWERLVEVEIQEVAPIPATARALRVGWEQVADHWARWDAVPADMPTWLDLSRWKPVA